VQKALSAGIVLMVTVAFAVRLVTINTIPALNAFCTFLASVARRLVRVCALFLCLGIADRRSLALAARTTAFEIFFHNIARNSLQHGPLVASFAIASLFGQFVGARNVVDVALAAKTVTFVFFLQRLAAVIFLGTPVITILVMTRLGTLLFTTRNRRIGTVIKTGFLSVRNFGHTIVFAAVFHQFGNCVFGTSLNDHQSIVNDDIRCPIIFVRRDIHDRNTFARHVSDV
jgi:hypothetical protein